MKFTISEVFCEIVSALGFIASFLPILLYLKLFTLGAIADRVANLAGTELLSLVLVAYILGVFLNIVGLPADRLMKRLGITGQYPEESSTKLFYQKASSDLFNFRTNTWNHYYCFRNLLTFSPFALCLWAPVVLIHWGWLASAGFIIVFVIIGWILYLAVKDHADLYSEVTKTFG